MTESSNCKSRTLKTTCPFPCESNKTALTRVTGSPWERVMLSQGANANAKLSPGMGRVFNPPDI